MSDSSDSTNGVVMLIIFIISLATIISIMLICCCNKQSEARRRRRNQTGAQPDQNSIYNISGRVQGQNQTQYPDAYLSVEHIAITNELNKPPKYDDAPPTYEEAIKLAMAHSNSIQTFQAEQPQASQQAHSSTSTLTVVVPAVPNQTTE